MQEISKVLTNLSMPCKTSYLPKICPTENDFLQFSEKEDVIPSKISPET